MRVIELLERKKLIILEFENPGESVSGKLVRTDELNIFGGKTKRYTLSEPDTGSEFGIFGTESLDKQIEQTGAKIGDLLELTLLETGSRPNDRFHWRFGVTLNPVPVSGK